MREGDYDETEINQILLFFCESRTTNTKILLVACPG